MLKPQGRRGEVLAELHTDFPQRFEERRRLWGLAPNGSRRELELQQHWFHKGAVVLKFAGVDSISDAEQLAEIEIQIPREERTELNDGAAYVSEIVGCDVWIGNGQRYLGRVSRVEFGAGEAPLLVVELPYCVPGKAGKPGCRPELLVPYAEEFVKKLDLAGQRIDMELPEGMLDVDTPLNSEEKNQQKAEAGEAKTAGEIKKRK